MFAKKFRLPATTKIIQSSNLSTRFFMFKYAKNSLASNRYGFVVSKRIDKRASVRNRVKRVVRSCFEELDQQMLQGHDLLVIIKREAVGKEREVVYKEVHEVLLKAKIIQE